MRHLIWKKTDFFYANPEHRIKGRLNMDPSVVRLPEKSIPLLWAFNTDPMAVLGTVSDIQLVDGEITGEVSFADTTQGKAGNVLLEAGDVRLGGYYTDVLSGKGVVRYCELKSVSLVINVPGDEGLRHE